MAALAGLLALSCDESLPPRDQPGQFLSVVLNEYGEVFNIGPFSANTALFRISVENTYDEVLQDSALMGGSVEVWDVARPNLRAVLPVKFAKTVPPISGGVITLDPNTELLVMVDWSHYVKDAVTDTTIPIWSGVPSVAAIDSAGQEFQLVDPITIRARATIQPFKTAGILTMNQVQFVARYHVYP